MTRLIRIDDLSDADIAAILSRAEGYAQGLSISPQPEPLQIVVSAFFEPSTRTQVSFEIAARRLGMAVVNLPIGNLSTAKGETFTDTMSTVAAMQPDCLVVRHREAGIIDRIASLVECGLINAGDGAGEHPTQALIDAFTIKQAKGRIADLRVAICGDVHHSRVAHSTIALLTRLGAEVRVVALGESSDDLVEAITGADVIMMLRLQAERHDRPAMVADGGRTIRLDAATLSRAKPDAIVMHPGPVHRDVEIATEIVDGPQSVIWRQVRNSVPVRMAVLERVTEAS